MVPKTPRKPHSSSKSTTTAKKAFENGAKDPSQG